MTEIDYKNETKSQRSWLFFHLNELFIYLLAHLAPCRVSKQTVL